MQEILSSVTKLCCHWICGPISRRTPQDFCEIACNSCRGNFPAPVSSRSMTNFGMDVPLRFEAVQDARPEPDVRIAAVACIEADAPGTVELSAKGQGQLSRLSGCRACQGPLRAPARSPDNDARRRSCRRCG